MPLVSELELAVVKADEALLGVATQIDFHGRARGKSLAKPRGREVDVAGRTAEAVPFDPDRTVRTLETNTEGDRRRRAFVRAT